MYFPYFRGKQYELITIRECAEIMSRAGFVPVIEPVKENLNGLIKTIDAIIDAEGKAVVIVNPHHGDHVYDSVALEDLFENEFKEHINISAGLLLTENISTEEVVAKCANFQDRELFLIHSTFNDSKALVLALSKIDDEKINHIFLDGYGSLYRKHFDKYNRVLIHNGFEKRRNKDHPSVEIFSELHITFKDMGMNGFGDFLIVGDEYSTTGGPAYAVAIHITYLDPDNDDVMYMHHFLSDRQDTPTDPAGKFLEALTKLVQDVESEDGKILRTDAINEFIELYNAGHFPGLGYVKKLSMKHHIETLIDYFERA